MRSAAFQHDLEIQREIRQGETTLLELVQAVADVTEDEREIVATVMYMLRSGHVRLCGNYRDEPIDRFCIDPF